MNAQEIKDLPEEKLREYLQSLIEKKIRAKERRDDSTFYRTKQKIRAINTELEEREKEK